MKTFLFCLGLLFSTSIASSEGEYRDIRNNTVKLNINGGNCSGTAVDESRVLTAAHCFGTTGVVPKLIYVNGRGLEFEYLNFDGIYDLAVIKFKGTKFEGIPTLDLMPKLDTPVLVSGYPQPYNYHIITSGIITDFDQEYMIMTASAAPGNSGGGVFVKEGGRYKLAGVLVSIATTCHLGPCTLLPYISRAIDTDKVNLILRRKL